MPKTPGDEGDLLHVMMGGTTCSDGLHSPSWIKVVDLSQACIHFVRWGIGERKSVRVKEHVKHLQLKKGPPDIFLWGPSGTRLT